MSYGPKMGALKTLISRGKEIDVEKNAFISPPPMDAVKIKTSEKMIAIKILIPAEIIITNGGDCLSHNVHTITELTI